MSDQAQFSAPCSICNQPILMISRVKADETGQPVHEDCYLAKVQASDPKPPIAHPALQFRPGRDSA